MESTSQRAVRGDLRECWVLGKKIELWEDPNVSFGWDEEDLADYASQERWEFLFNALVLSSSLDPETEVQP